MKDNKRKMRDWENDNYIMRQYGKTIRAHIAEALFKTQKSITTYESIALEQQRLAESVPRKDPDR